MMHHRLAIGTDLQIRLDAEAAGHRRGKGGGGIFDHAIGGVVQAAMRDRSGGEPVKARHERPHRRLSDFELTLDFHRGVGRQRRDADG